MHHVIELEHLFDAIETGLTSTGVFLTSDMIGRNGHMRWPEALAAMQPYWESLPNHYKYNQLLKRQENQFINHDCSTEGFEFMRAQDILPLLTQKFGFNLFIPFANIIMPFIDRSFGHNFDANNETDLAFIDQVHETDERLIYEGILKPTQMIAALCKNKSCNTLLTNPKLTPEFCIRSCRASGLI